MGHSTEFITIEQAHRYYDLSTRISEDTSLLDSELGTTGIARINVDASDSDFEDLLGQYEECIFECPEILAETYYSVDDRMGSDVGQVRKNIKINPVSGLQTEDGKNYFHVTEGSLERWGAFLMSPETPNRMKTFIESAGMMHAIMVEVGKRRLADFEATHPNITELYFPLTANGIRESRVFLRLAIYDAYEASSDDQPTMSDVAKPHNDIGGFSTQLYADAPGFWAANSQTGERVFYDTHDGEGYMFMGASHSKIYGPDDAIQKKLHGVSRTRPDASQIVVPERRIAVGFYNPPRVDCDIKPEDCLPQLSVFQHPDAIIDPALQRALIPVIAA